MRAKEFCEKHNISMNNANVTKHYYKLSYQELDNLITYQQELLEKVRDKCISLEPKDIKYVFNHCKYPDRTASSFLSTLYSEKSHRYNKRTISIYERILND